MNEEMTTTDFSYLQGWTTDQLRKRLGYIMPQVEFMMSMHNAKDKVAQIDLRCIDAKSGIIKEFTVHCSSFDKLSTGKNGFPTTLEVFIHNFCTFLCAEKMHIELLLETR